MTKFILVGYLGSPPTKEVTPTGSTFYRLRMAVHSRDETQWYTVRFYKDWQWLESLPKGTLLAAEGRLFSPNDTIYLIAENLYIIKRGKTPQPQEEIIDLENLDESDEPPF